MVGYLFILLVVLSVSGFVAGRMKAAAARSAGGASGFHSRPVYHGANVAVYTGVPALVLVLVWLLFQGSVINHVLLAGMPDAASVPLSERDLLLSEIQQVASGNIFREPTPEVAAAAQRLNSLKFASHLAMFALAAALAIAGMTFAWSRISARYTARHSVERAMNLFMIFCSIVAILTTLGIIASLVYEAAQFFRRVPMTEFFFGMRWEPQIPMREDQVAGSGAFGAVPVFLGTMVIATLAMLVAVPIGLLAAVYLTEYASERFRSIVKPLLEILAGIPTVVYGFFAVLIMAPAIREFGMSLGFDVSPNSALAAGTVMGVMLIPFVSSLSDDALAAVPQSMRDGSFALGATKGETIRKVLLPAALPGIVGGILLALSRAVGETMIVVMAAGLIATMNVNPLDSVTTVTVQIVTLLIGDTEFDNPKTLAAFALGLMLFIITLGLNVIALRIVRKYREMY
jgi:phosphate transport system permease protein